MHHNLMDDTMLEMNWYEIESKARDNALVIFPIGVVEEHGKHLPLGTDIYLATLQAKNMANYMRQNDYACIIAPPYYWGINSVLTRCFPGSFTLKDNTLKLVITDILSNLEDAGFTKVLFVNAHGDPVHRKVITKKIEEFNNQHKLIAKWMTFSCDLLQEGFTGEENYIIELPDELLDKMGNIEGELLDQFDVHAGAFETATMRDAYPELTNLVLANEASATNLKDEQITQWLKGDCVNRNIIFEGHVGNPSAHKQITTNMKVFHEAIAEYIMRINWN